MIMTLEEAKEYLKVDYEDEDLLIESYIFAAEAYLKNATGREFDNTNDLAVLYCKCFIYEMFKNKNLMCTSASEKKARYTTRSILLQLKLGG